MRPCDLASGGRIIAAMSCSRHAPGYGGAAAGAPTLTGMTQSAPAAGPADAERPLGTAVERDLSAAFGVVVRSTAAITTMGAGLKAMCQGEVTQNTELLEDSRKHAIDRMIENARLLGANAVVAARFDSSGRIRQLTELVAHGTAVAARPAGRAHDTVSAAALRQAIGQPGRPAAAAGLAAGTVCQERPVAQAYAWKVDSTRPPAPRAVSLPAVAGPIPRPTPVTRRARPRSWSRAALMRARQQGAEPVTRPAVPCSRSR